MRRDRRQHIPRLQQLLLDGRYARQHLECRAEIVAPHAIDGGAELVQAQFHPQFGNLMNDDEQHFVVLVGQGMLSIQQLVEIEVLRVAQRLAEVPMYLLVAQIDEWLEFAALCASFQVLNTQPGTVRQPASNSRSKRR